VSVFCVLYSKAIDALIIGVDCIDFFVDAVAAGGKKAPGRKGKDHDDFICF
jgi:hypothetical protein